MSQVVDVERTEAALRAYPGVAAAALTVEAEGKALTAYVVPRDLSAPAREIQFSLFYFADADPSGPTNKYELYLEGARFADEHGFEAVWTPERHFHENGGLYPNPSVLSAALATITRNLRLRAGSVALPLHHSLRVAEEWSVVDNLSNGRVDLSVTSGWVPNDFSVSPDPTRFKSKREGMLRQIEEVQRLWQGGRLAVRDGVGNDVELEIFPKPIQPRLPLWMTCSGDPRLFEQAGEMGLNILTGLLTQSLEEVAEKIDLYRAARARAGHDPRAGIVTMMIHTFVGEDEEQVREQARGPMLRYFRSHIGLIKTMAQSLNLQLDHVDTSDPRWIEYLASFAFERYYRLGSLIGTPAKCLEMVAQLKERGVDEVACLIDFGIDVPTVLASLPHLAHLRELSNPPATLTRAGLRAFLHEQVGPLPSLSVQLVTALPRGGAAPSPVMATETLQEIDERAQKQRAARDRQKEQMRRGRP